MVTLKVIHTKKILSLKPNLDKRAVSGVICTFPSEAILRRVSCMVLSFNEREKDHYENLAGMSSSRGIFGGDHKIKDRYADSKHFYSSKIGISSGLKEMCFL